jgi:hypothetical protein
VACVDAVRLCEGTRGCGIRMDVAQVAWPTHVRGVGGGWVGLVSMKPAAVRQVSPAAFSLVGKLGIDLQCKDQEEEKKHVNNEVCEEQQDGNVEKGEDPKNSSEEARQT